MIRGSFYAVGVDYLLHKKNDSELTKKKSRREREKEDQFLSIFLYINLKYFLSDIIVKN